MKIPERTPPVQVDAATEAIEAADQLSWPPWLENLTPLQSIRAIVAAVAECASSPHGTEQPLPEQHCTPTMAEHFLVKLMLPGPRIYGRIEMPGYRHHTGWITEQTIFGQPAAVVRDWDGNQLAAVFPGPGCQLVCVPTPLRRPAAITTSRPTLDDWQPTADDIDEAAAMCHAAEPARG